MSSKSGAANSDTASGQIVYFPAKGHVATKGHKCLAVSYLSLS